jgi:hypothetical protein
MILHAAWGFSQKPERSRMDYLTIFVIGLLMVLLYKRRSVLFGKKMHAYPSPMMGGNEPDTQKIIASSHVESKERS